jgi:hypothetical protein
LRDRQRTQAGQSESIGQRFAREQAKALPLPARPFDACVSQPGQVDKYQTVQFDRNRYSVPRLWAFRTVTVHGYVDAVTVVACDQVIAQHRRSYAQGELVLDPLHYLAVLGHKPAALDHANVFRHWGLPPLFDELRRCLEAEHGGKNGGRHFIRVLQLLALHPLERVERAIHMSRSVTGFDIAAILRRAPGPKECCAESAPGAAESPTSRVLGAVQAPPPNLRLFDQLLSVETNHERCACPAVDQGQPQAAAAAGDACGV